MNEESETLTLEQFARLHGMGVPDIPITQPMIEAGRTRAIKEFGGVLFPGTASIEAILRAALAAR